MSALLRPLAGLALALAASPVLAQPPAPDAPVDYADPARWLCLPGRADACAVDLSAMRVNARGAAALEEFDPARTPRIDCFYVYPTVSADGGAISDLNPGVEERRVVARQFARFTAACRPFAPIYRQYTVQSVRARVASGAGAVDAIAPPEQGVADTPYADVRDAFRLYLERYNQGRGVVLIGHSQGARHLARLIAEEIDGKALQGQLVSAILLGANVQVPPGLNAGGSFKSIPLCRAENQTGCVITYSAFRDTNPPASQALFGQGIGGLIAGCTNPADLRRGTGEPESYFAPGGLNWTGDAYRPVGTPFVRTPGLITTTCVSGPAGTYLQVHVNADPKGARIDDIPGDFLTQGRRDPAWGLHLIDMDLSIGDLVRIVERQGRSWRAPS